MEAELQLWHKIKSELRNQTKEIYFKEREIWWCFVGLNVGYEENGKGHEFERPVLVVKKFSRYLFLGVPLSTKLKPENKYYANLRVKNRKRSAMLFQLKAGV